MAMNNLQDTPQVNGLEVVVAHFNEDLSWLMPVAPVATIYIKGIKFKTLVGKRISIST